MLVMVLKIASSMAIAYFHIMIHAQLKLKRGGVPKTVRIVRQGMTTKYERNSV